MITHYRHARLALVAGLIGTLVPGCGLRAIKRQSDQIEAYGEIRGRVELQAGLSGPSIAVLLSDDGSFLTVRSHFPLTRSGEYAFLVPPGRYVVAAFVDTSGDGRYQVGEPATYAGIESGPPDRIVLPRDGRFDLDRLTINGPMESDQAFEVGGALPKAISNIGRVVSLKDPIFSREVASTGYWRPVEYIREFGGGLFMLQDYQQDRIPIVFVHGANGTALDFETVIASVDRRHYQPWVLQYPSGARLDMISNYLLRALTQLHAEYRFEGMVLVAHSMGGLVARSFVMRHQLAAGPIRILMVMTVNSPMDGMRSAQSGVAHSPIVVPSWRDVAHDSQFVREIRGWPWPREIPYCLVFSFKLGEGDDGVVALDSQLPPSLQAEASKIRGFIAEHTGTLRDGAFVSYFRETLADIRAR